MADVALKATAAGTTISASNSITVTLPAGIAAGDFLLVQIDFSSAPTVTLATGWSLVRETPNGTAIKQGLYWKVAVAGEANPRFTLSASATATACATAWTGVDSVRTLVQNGTTGTSTTPSSPALTADQPNCIYVQTIGKLTGTNENIAPTTGYTEAYEIDNGTTVSSMMDWKNLGVAGSSGTPTLPVGTSAAWVGQGVLLQSTNYATFRSGQVIAAVTATTIGITIPAGLAANDIWVTHIFVNNTTVTVTAPVSGGTWNSLTTVTNGTSFKIWIFWKRANAGETTNTFTLSTSATTSAMSYAYRNAPTTGSPFDGTPSTNSGTGTAVSELSVTPTQTNTTLLGMALGSSSNANLITPDAAMFERADNSHHLQDAVLTTAVASGNKSATLSTSMTWTGVLAALLSTTSVAGGPSGPPFLRPARQLLPLIAR